MLAEAKQGLQFKNPKNDTWILRPSREVTVNSALSKDAAGAIAYLNRVAAEHPDTPWALDAERELKQPLGWKWSEAFTDVARRLAENQNGNRRRRPERQMPPEKPRRDPPAL